MTETHAFAADPAELAGLAVELAREAGVLMLDRRSAGLAVSTKSSPTDVVTDADRAVEQFLGDELRRKRPGDAVLGEEGTTGPDDGSTARTGVRWIIDPIDGTVNFMLGLPQFSVSIAAEVDGQVVAGCVHNPSSGALFHATLGGGAFLDGERLAGPRDVELGEAVVATGFAYDADKRAQQGAVLAQVVHRVGNIRRMGSAALDLCALAAGWVDAYYEATLHYWDYAAGALIAAEAGAAVRGLYGRPPGSDMLIAAHPSRIAEFAAMLEGAKA